MSDAIPKELTSHCDLISRLSLVPEGACVRGFLFRNLTALAKTDQSFELQRLYPKRYTAIHWYPTRDYLEQLAVAGALLAGPEKVHTGMREIGRRNALAFSESLIGKITNHVLSPDPPTLLKQGAAARHLTCNYGKWELRLTEPHHAIMTMQDEFLWIESHVLGAAEGTFESIGKKATIEVQLQSAFSGRHILSWD